MSFWWRCKCCKQYGCEIARDTFTRADSDTIGAASNGELWVEVAGVWQIVDERLKHVSGSGAICINKTTNPYPGNNMVVYSSFHNIQDGARYRILVQTDLAGSDYFYGEWYFYKDGDDYKSTWTLGDSGGVIKTLEGGDWTEGGNDSGVVTISQGGQLGMHGDASIMTACVEPKAGKYAGVMSAGVAGGSFDGWIFSAHEMDNPVCPSFDCSCDFYCVNDDLMLEYEEIFESPSLDGVTKPLTNSGPIKYGSDWYTGEFPVGPAGGTTHSWKMTCGAGGANGPESFTLYEIYGGVSSGKTADPTVSTCEPFALRFGPYSCGNVSTDENCDDVYQTFPCGGFPCPPATSDYYVWVYEYEV